MMQNNDVQLDQRRADMDAATASVTAAVAQMGVSMQQVADAIYDVFSGPVMRDFIEETLAIYAPLVKAIEEDRRLMFPEQYMDWRDTPLTGLLGKLEAWGRWLRVEMGGG